MTSSSEPLTYRTIAFEALSPHELYACLALRAQVFVLEQACAYVDPDGDDERALHLLGEDAEGALLSYARIFLADEASGAAHRVGRVVVAPSRRGCGEGRRLMREAIERSLGAAPRPIDVSAQSYLERFYTSLGFERTSSVYLLDGIEHVDMRRPPVDDGLRWG